ncbi:MAG TPA: pyridine nucleotide-disulfide oxidoreductase, partial [Syntrophobacteraceae bacterium]|nr:pyridine nucleotide-disulfide oxidoreductase [Syntrophobacteraceae bacterium]
MAASEKTSTQAETYLPKEIQEQLRGIFDQTPNSVPILVFTQKGNNDPLNQAVREMLKAFQSVSSKIQFQELDLAHDLAKKYQVSTSPTLVFAPDQYRIRYLGAPFGEEGRTFLHILMAIAFGSTNVSEQSQKVLKGIDAQRNIKVFVSPTCPYCPQQAANAIKAAIALPALVSLEIVDIYCNPELANRYSAQSVPQTYANEVLIARGAQTEELFMLSLQKMEQQTLFIPDSDAELVENDLVIVGAGPAGLTAGIYAVRSGLTAAVVERGSLGGQVATTPIVENYPGFNQVGGKTLVDIMVSHALEYVQLFPDEEVVDIEPGDPIQITTSRRRFRTRAVLLATGASHRHLEVAGEARLAGRGVSYCSTCDGPLFKGKRAIMVGGGNSAVTEALHLHHIGVHVTLVHRRDHLRAQDHLVKNLTSNNIPIIWNTEITEIHGEKKVESVLLYNHQSGQTTVMATDAVFVAVGYAPAVELAKKVGVQLTADGFIQRDERHRTNIPGIYSAGDVEGGFKQIVT